MIESHMRTNRENIFFLVKKVRNARICTRFYRGYITAKLIFVLNLLSFQKSQSIIMKELSEGYEIFPGW